MLYKISHLNHNAFFRSKNYQLKEINTLQLKLKILMNEFFVQQYLKGNNCKLHCESHQLELI